MAGVPEVLAFGCKNGDSFATIGIPMMMILVAVVMVKMMLKLVMTMIVIR